MQQSMTYDQISKLDGSKPIRLYRISCPCGPSVVIELAKRLSGAGLIDVYPGTETLYWSCSGNSPDHALQRSRESLFAEYGQDFGLWQSPFPMVIGQV